MGRSLIGAAIVAMRVRVGTRILQLYGNRPRLMKALSRSPIGMLLYCRRNTDSETTTSLLKWGADDVSTRMFVQLMDGVWNINFRQYFPITFREQPYDYTMNMDLLSTPMLFVTGDKDFASWVGIKRYGYDRVSSEIKVLVTLPGYGHTDLVMGRDVEWDVYPVILEWIREVEKVEG